MRLVHTLRLAGALSAAGMALLLVALLRAAGRLDAVALVAAVLGGAALALGAAAALPRLTAGLDGLRRAAHRLRDGDLATPVKAGHAGDEVAEVAAALEAMRRQVAAGAVSSDRLEDTVAERTAELERSRAELAARVMQLEAARAQLSASERLAAVGRLARGLTHEINNPLSVAIASIDFAAEELRDPGGERTQEDVQAALEDAGQACRRVARIVRDLMAFARGQGAPSGPSDLAEVLEQAGRLVGPELRARARFSLALPGGPLLVQGGGAALSQVVVQLLLEAAAAIPPGQPERHEVSVEVTVAGPDVRVDVRDTGPPIPPEILAHVFDPFYRPNHGFSAPAGARGEGLALAACHGLVEAAGGHLTAESGAAGTVFHVRLRAATSRTRVRLRDAEAGAGRPRVLVLDDDPLACAGLYRALSARFDVVPHTSPTHAAALIEAGETFDAVVCDLQTDPSARADFQARLASRTPELAASAVHLVSDPPHADEAAFLATHGVSGLARTAAPEVLVRRVEAVCGEP